MIFHCPGFERRYKKLTPQQKTRIDAAIGRFEEALGRPHQHSALSLRPFGRYLEFRAGLDFRILALAESGDWFLMCVGNHDTIRAYVKDKP
jgi:hypothetical protein